MLKTLRNSVANEREAFVIPKSVQASVPIDKIFRDGIWKVGNNYSMTWKITDINFAVASEEDKRTMLLQYCAFLNSLPTDATIKITIYNRKLNLKEFRQSLMLPGKKDSLDQYRGEYNRMLQDKAEATQNMVQEKYITVSISKKTIEEARAAFGRIGIDLATNLSKLSSIALVQDNQERLKLLHDFFRPEDEPDLNINLKELMRRGHNFKDSICPDSMQFKADHFEMDDKVGRVLFLKDYASFIRDDMVAKLTDVSRNIMLCKRHPCGIGRFEWVDYCFCDYRCSSGFGVNGLWCILFGL